MIWILSEGKLPQDVSTGMKDPCAAGVVWEPQILQVLLQILPDCAGLERARDWEGGGEHKTKPFCPEYAKVRKR